MSSFFFSVKSDMAREGVNTQPTFSRKGRSLA
jgi:hypothetical protein